jgi:hypothetical protein
VNSDTFLKLSEKEQKERLKLMRKEILLKLFEISTSDNQYITPAQKVSAANNFFKWSADKRKSQHKKDENGKPIKDSNGKPIYESVPDNEDSDYDED